jgi:uncharacterized protein YjbJ (UPF0337 family)
MSNNAVEGTRKQIKGKVREEVGQVNQQQDGAGQGQD